MRVLINLQDAQIGGGQRVAAQIASGLAKRGHHIGVLTARGGPALAWFPQETGVHLIDLTTLRQPQSIAKAAGVLRHYDVLYSHVAVGGQLAGAMASRGAGKAQVLHQHNPVRFSDNVLIRAVQRELYRWLLTSSEFIAVAPHIRRDLAAAGIPNDRIHVVVNGVETAIRRSAKRSNGRFTVGMLSRLYPTKRIDVFITAAALLRSTSARFIVGGSPGTGPDYAEGLYRQAKAAGVEFVEPGSSAASFLDALDIVCIPSEHEGLPLVLLEALALGKSVVGSDIPAISDVTEPFHAAHLVPVGDAEALAKAVRELIADPCERQRLADVGPKLIRSRYTVEQMIDAAIRVIEGAA